MPFTITKTLISSCVEADVFLAMEATVETTSTNPSNNHNKHTNKKAVHWVESRDLEEVRYYYVDNNTPIKGQDEGIEPSSSLQCEKEVEDTLAHHPHPESDSSPTIDNRHKRVKSSSTSTSTISCVNTSSSLPLTSTPISTSHQTTYRPTVKRSACGLLFSIGRIGSMLSRGRYAKRVGQGAAVYLTAVLQYVCTEIVDDAVLLCEEEGRDKIDPKRIGLVIKADSELLALFPTCFHDIQFSSTSHGTPSVSTSTPVVSGGEQNVVDSLLTEGQGRKESQRSEQGSPSTSPCTDGELSPVTIGSSSEAQEGDSKEERNESCTDIEDVDLIEAVEDIEIDENHSHHKPEENHNNNNEKVVEVVSSSAQTTEIEPKPVFADYIYHVFKQICHSTKGLSVHQIQHRKTMSISKKAIRLLNTLLSDLFGRLAFETSRLVRQNNMETFSARYVEMAVNKVLRGDMVVYAQVAGNDAVRAFMKL